MTLYEVRCAVVAHNWHRARERKAQRDLALRTAWMTANLSRTKRLPSLESLEARMSKPKVLTAEEEKERRGDLEAGKAALAKLGGKLAALRPPSGRRVRRVTRAVDDEAGVGV